MIIACFIVASLLLHSLGRYLALVHEDIFAITAFVAAELVWLGTAVHTGSWWVFWASVLVSVYLTYRFLLALEGE